LKECFETVYLDILEEAEQERQKVV